MRVNSMTTKLYLPPKLDDRDNYKQTFRKGIKATKLNKKKKEKKKRKEKVKRSMIKNVREEHR